MKDSVLKTHVPFSSVELKDTDLVVETLLDCIKADDLDTFREVLTAHLMSVDETD
jgi:hypothetical protein